MVAFHFLRSDQAGWKCEQCRRQSLEARRRCGFLAPEERDPQKVVWARNGAVAEECPKSLITAESTEFVERYLIWKMAPGCGLSEHAAREADAFLTLEKEWRTEQFNEQSK